MTNEHYLEVAKECGAVIHSDGNIFFTNVTKLSAYTARICAEKDAEITNLHEVERLRDEEIAWLREAHGGALGERDNLLEKLSTANAAIAMKDEALKRMEEKLITYGHERDGSGTIRDILHSALSASPESIAAWEAEKLLPLQRQVAMLQEMVARNIAEFNCDKVRAEDAIKNLECQFVLADSQATAEAYDREHTAKVLEDAAEKFSSVEGYTKNIRVEISGWLELQAEALRAANKKENG